MSTFGLLKTKAVAGAFGFTKKTKKEIITKNNKNIAVIAIKNIFCLFFGDIKTTAILV